MGCPLLWAQVASPGPAPRPPHHLSPVEHPAEPLGPLPMHSPVCVPSLLAGSRSLEKRLPFSLRKSHSALKAAPQHPPAPLAQVVYLKDIVCYLSLLERGRAEDKLECEWHPCTTGCWLLGELGGVGGDKAGLASNLRGCRSQCPWQCPVSPSLFLSLLGCNPWVRCLGYLAAAVWGNGSLAGLKVCPRWDHCKMLSSVRPHPFPQEPKGKCKHTTGPAAAPRVHVWPGISMPFSLLLKLQALPQQWGECVV